MPFRRDVFVAPAVNTRPVTPGLATAYAQTAAPQVPFAAPVSQAVASSVMSTVTTGGGGGGPVDQVVPYDSTSAWNTPIGPSPTVHANSAGYITALNAVGGGSGTQHDLSCDPVQFTIPVYVVDSSTPTGSVRLTAGTSGWTYNNGDNVAVRVPAGTDATGIPIPPSLTSVSSGDDSQMVIWNPTTGVEWTFWRFSPAQHTNTNGTDVNTGIPNYTPPGSGVEWVAQAYMQSHTKTDGSGNHYYGRCNGTSSGGTASVSSQTGAVGGRGAGTSYFAGLLRPWEIDAGVINHALAFACNRSASSWVYPASKSDGSNNAGAGTNIPEGTRFQLDPTKTTTDFDNLLNAYTYGNTTYTDQYDFQPMPTNHKRTAKIIMKCLQDYGMYNIDNSGSSKIYVEDNTSARNGAGWAETELIRETLNAIPWSWFRAVTAPPGN